MKKYARGEGITDLTTIALKKKTRDKLDNLGFDRHSSYDLIINTILNQRKEFQTTYEMIEGVKKEIQQLREEIVI